MSYEWPDQAMPESQKKQPEYLQNCLEYAIMRYRSRDWHRNIFARMRAGYNGDTEQSISTMLNNTYGPENKAKYVDFNFRRGKVDTLIGEFISTPLRASVKAENAGAKSQKYNAHSMLMGMHMLQDQIKFGREEMGMDIMAGMQAPQSADPLTWPDANEKSKNEIIMQYALNYQINQRNWKSKLANNYMDLCLMSECFGKSYIDENGDVQYMNILPEDSMYEEFHNDPYLERSPWMGHRQPMTKSEIINYFNLTLGQRGKVNSMFVNGYSPTKYDNYLQDYNDVLCAPVYFLEWHSLEPWRQKVSWSDKRKEQFVADLSNDYYEKNQEKLMEGVQQGRFVLDVKYKKRLWEGVRILPDMYIGGKKKNCIARNDTPFAAYSSYSGMVFNTHNNKRVSFFNLMENVNTQINLTHFQIRRELYRMKGNILTYDRAMLPTNKNGVPVHQNTILYKMINDGILDYNSRAQSGYGGNLAGANLTDIAQAIKQIDLGASQSLSMLILIAQDLERLLDKISSVNGDRQGSTKTSATVTNAQSNIEGSRTMTEWLRYSFDRYIENAGMRLLEYTKVSWSYLNPDRARAIIGDAGVKFLRDTIDLSNDDYAMYMEDTRSVKENRQMISEALNNSLNAKEIAPADALRAQLSETQAEMLLAAEKGWDSLRQYRDQQQNRLQELKNKGLLDQTNAQTADREDQQAHDIDVVRAKGIVNTAHQTQKAINQQALTSSQEQPASV